MTRRTKILGVLVSLTLGAAQAWADSAKQIEVPAGDLLAAIEVIAKQSEVELFYQREQLKGLKTAGIEGTYTTQEAVRKLLEGTQLRVSTDARTGAMMIVSKEDRGAALEEAAQAPLLRLAQAGERKSASIAQDDVDASQGIPEVLVKGSKILNMDIKRSRDGVQPYVILNRETIERSSAQNIEDFLKQRLPMNTVSATQTQSGATFAGAISSINLRGMGSGQTLILVDGRRVSSAYAFGSSPAQPDINGIPLGAVERIEVLPTTASGIYGGGATGGVVNIIRKRNYQGAEARLRYDVDSHGDSDTTGVDISGGINFNGGKTSLMVTGSFSDVDPLAVGDRDFVQAGRQRVLLNNPSFYLNATTPPLGSTPNIRSTNGSPLFGPGTSNITYVPAGYAGGGGLVPFQANAGRYNLAPADSAQNSGLKQFFTNAMTQKSLSFTVRHEFSSRVEMFVDLVGSENRTHTPSSPVNATNGYIYTVPATAPTNPFGQSVTVAVPLQGFERDFETTYKDGRVVSGLIVRLGGDWQLGGDFTYDRFSSLWVAAGGAPVLDGNQTANIANGSWNLLRDTIAFPIDLGPYLTASSRLLEPQVSTLRDTIVRASGPVFRLPAGAATLSMSAEYRSEQISDTVQTSSASAVFYPARGQSVTSGYAELRLPVFARPNARRGAEELELQLAVRTDDYEVDGTSGFTTTATAPVLTATNKTRSTNPTVGLLYKPVRDIALRASYGTGFLPPSVTQLAPSLSGTPISGIGFLDPKRGGQSLTTYLGTGGGNPDLRPEDSESYSAGVIVTPRVLEGLRLSVDYTRIKKTDNIISLTPQQVLTYEDLLPGRIVRGANLPGDLPGWAGPVTALDYSAVNLASTLVEAYDVALDYAWATSGWGKFSLFSVATWQTHYLTKVIPTVAAVENVGITFNSPLKFKANAGLNWSRGPWSVNWVTSYYDSYLVADPSISTNATVLANQGGAQVSSQVYHDLGLKYQFAERGGALGALTNNTEIQFGVRNVFDTRPPFDASFIRAGNVEYRYSPYGDPRMRSYLLTLKRVF